MFIEITGSDLTGFLVEILDQTTINNFPWHF